MTFLRGGLRDLGAIFWMGLRLLGQHWPQLLALYLLGAAGRMGFLWLALGASKVSSLLGVLLLPFAPICTLLSLIFMLRVLGESLPAFSNSFAEQKLAQRMKSNLKLAAQVLIPFLAVYAAQGLLREDTRLFIYSSTLDESLNNPLTANFGRAVIPTGLLIAVVVTALVARKLIAAYKLTDRSLRWGAVSGYLEALWTITLGTSFAWMVGALKDWVSSRVVVAQATSQWQHFTLNTGVLGEALGRLSGWLATTLGSMSELVLVPVAWLAIGATLYGSKLAAGSLPTHERMTQQLAKIPNPLQRAAAQALEPITTPIKSTFEAISKVAAAGILPMVLFCVAFSLFGTLIKLGVAWLSRLLLGPQPSLLQLGLEPYVGLVERGAYFVLSIVLVGAAVNRVLMTRQEKEREAEAAKSQDSVQPASA